MEWLLIIAETDGGFMNYPILLDQIRLISSLLDFEMYFLNNKKKKK